MRVVSVQEMREVEAQTFARGVPELELQLRAGRAVADAIVEGGGAARAVVSFIGPGNNGRDAWIAAEVLAKRGWDATLYLTPRHAVQDEELEGFVAAGGRLVWHPDGSSLGVRSVLARAQVAVDGLLGIGGRGAPRPPLADLIDVVNQTRAQRDNLWVLAVDVPSGLDADTGLPSASTVFADATVMLGGAKQGLLLPSAFPYTGTLLFADIDVVDGPIWAPRILYRESAQGLAARPAGDAHKGTFGRLLVVAGSELYVGAALLTCAAAARSGAGIVTLAAPGWLRNIAASRAPEVTFLSLPDGRSDEAAATALDAIASHLAGFTALAIGPGLSMDPYTLTLVEGVLRERARLAIPTVVDADALNALAQIDGWARWSGENLVLTPHPGEFARLAPHRDDGSPPWRQARVGAEEWGVTLVLKGACTVIADPSEVWVHARPNPALATGGTGDVLTGMVGGLLAQGLEPSEAARLAVWAHGEAARRARHGSLDRGLLPSDLLGEIPEALGTVLGPRV